MTPHQFRAALAHRGYRLRNTQDGAHELYHALTCGVPLGGGGKGHREKLNDAIESCFPGGIDRWWNEVEARCVERLVCKRLGTEHELMQFDRAILLSIEEAEYFSVPTVPFERSFVYARAFINTKRAHAAVDLMFAYALREERTNGNRDP